MPISVTCACGKKFAARDELAGKRVKCPGCGQPLEVRARPENSRSGAEGAAVPVRCKCGKAFSVPAKLAGKAVKCPGCSEPIRVPAQVGGAAKVTTKCSCGQLFQAPANLAGKAVRCPACQQPVRVPSVSTQPAQVAAVPPPSSPGPGDLGSLLDEIGFQQAAATHRCPKCKSDMAARAILCIECGYNVETGKQLATKVISKNKRAAASPAPPAKAKKRPQSKTSILKRIWPF